MPIVLITELWSWKYFSMNHEYGNSQSFHLAAASCSKNIGFHYMQYLIIYIWAPGDLLKVPVQTLFKFSTILLRYVDFQAREYQ